MKRMLRRSLPGLLRRTLPQPAYNAVRVVSRPGDLMACVLFVLAWAPKTSRAERMRLVRQLYRITLNVESPHTQQEMLAYIGCVLAVSSETPGVVVEAGCFKGSSTAKFSLAADIVHRELVVFDSFQGIPENDERHERNIYGETTGFVEGSYCGTLDEVRANVAEFGRIGRCRFVPGWFDDTMPQFSEPIAAAYIDVDLVSSTRCCLKYLYPLLVPGGVLYFQDGHLPLVIEALADDHFWETELGCARPEIEGLGKRKLVRIVKPA